MKLLNLESGGAGDATPTPAEPRQHGNTAESVEKAQEPFPLQCLGATLEAIGRAICATERTPETLAGCCLLGIVSASIGAGLQVQSAPDRLTRGNLYILASAESGSGKSETFRHAARPFQRLEAEIIRAWEEQKRPGLLADKDLLEIEVATLKRKLGSNRSIGRDEARKQMQDLKAKLQTAENALSTPALSCEDVSTERLAALLAENYEQIASLSADARGVIDNLLGRYTKGKATDEAIYLKAFSGDALRVDRISRAPVVLIRPCLTVLLLVQPDKLELLLGSQSLSDGGLLPRFLACHTRCEPQEIGEETPAIPVSVETAYHALIRNLLSLYRLADCPATVQPTDEAKAAMNEHFNSFVRRRKNGGDLHDVTSYASRWTEQAWRIAVCLQAAKHGKDAASNTLDLETAQRAIAIADWFARQQLEILNAGRQKARQDDQDKVLSLLVDKPEGITVRDAQLKRIKPDAESCRVLLANMESAGLLVGRDKKPEGGGPVSRIFTRALR